MKLLWVGLGGAIGAILRFLIAELVQRGTRQGGFPWGTLAVNVIGCLVIGWVAGHALGRGGMTPPVRYFVVIGVLGGFTTFSSFGLETWSLAQAGQLSTALANIALQMLLGLGGVAVGMWVARLG
ncbi:MAG: fluoride efflux transporter CrcB [Candidatus Eisenbacteria bacterium]|nr:fluoride efflux transporter CrcB [Candidatus Eisenbacteria bacterium]MCC7143389.1 fluoride efflux transporter CrcB [Candidatus Eisenbacteria bacterium]